MWFEDRLFRGSAGTSLTKWPSRSRRKGLWEARFQNPPGQSTAAAPPPSRQEQGRPKGPLQRAPSGLNVTYAPTWGGTGVLGAEPRSTLEAGPPTPDGARAFPGHGPPETRPSRDGPPAWRLHALCRVPAGVWPCAGLGTCDAGRKGPPGRSGRHERLLVQGRGQDVLAVRRELHKGHRGVVVICAETGGLTHGAQCWGLSRGSKEGTPPSRGNIPVRPPLTWTGPRGPVAWASRESQRQGLAGPYGDLGTPQPRGSSEPGTHSGSHPGCQAFGWHGTAGRLRVELPA